MPIFIRLLSAVTTSLPAAVFWLIISRVTEAGYYWPAYIFTGGAFLVASFLSGFFLPGLFPAHWRRYPFLWLFIQGGLAWLAAELVFALAHFSPLCIGRENGDGTNNLMDCMGQAVMMSLVYSPVELILLLLSAIPGGWLIKKLFKSEPT
jgi:hypothetical protein